MVDPRNDMMLLLSPSTPPGPSVQATLDWSMLVETSLDLLVWVTLDLPVLLSLDGQCRPVSASRGIPGPVAMGDLRMVSSERVSPIYCT